MKITTELALPIVNQLMSLLEFNVNIMDHNGYIVASGEAKRIGQQHEGALQVLSSKEQLLISEQESMTLPGSRPGVNLPIEFQNNIVGVVGITGDPGEVYKFGTIIKMNVEVLLQQIYMSKQLHYRKMALEGLIMELISPYDFSEKKLIMTARSLDIDVSIERSVMLVEIEEMKWGEDSLNNVSLQKINERKDNFLNDLKALINFQSLYSYLEEGTFFIAVPTKEKQQTPMYTKVEAHLQKLGYQYSIGIGLPRGGLSGYKESYNEAKQCLRLTHKFGQKQKVTSIEDWGIVPYLDTIPQDIQNDFLHKFMLAHQALSEEYKQTLRTFMDCDLDVKQTAALLHVHRNTLFYRLDKISQQINLDYRKFNDLVKMKLLLVFDQLQK
jgi:carbohydrate diacid regulator